MPTRSPVQRSTEGSRTGSGVARNDKGGSRPAGRPPGSKNKSKSLVPTDLAEQILLKMRGSIPDEHFNYLKGVIKRGDSISTKRELDVLILLLNRNLWPAMMAESGPYSDSSPTFRKDVTERLKVLNSLLTLRNQIEKGERGEDTDGGQPLLSIFAERSIAGRLNVLVGIQPSGVSGSPDGTGRSPIRVGAVPDQAPERPLLLSAGEQGEADRVLDGNRG